MRKTLYFTGSREVEVRTEPIPAPAPDQVRVRTELTAISAGTEMLIYRGQAPEGMAADEALDSLSGSLDYPLTYGYSAVGEVEAVGAEVGDSWLGRRVFAFQPHTSHFISPPEALIPIPDGLASEEAVFLPNMETAVNLVMDARPIIGERVCVFGQGVVGLLTTALLSCFPLERLITVDQHAKRRGLSTAIGADRSLSPKEEGPLRSIFRVGANVEYTGADLIFELTGQPAVLNDALSIAGYDGRILVGSWYGKKQAPIDLGSQFHRNRVQIVSSQVSTINPSFRGRWSKTRRIEEAMSNLGKINTKQFITHYLDIKEASNAYRVLDTSAGDVIQVVIQYS